MQPDDSLIEPFPYSPEHTSRFVQKRAGMPLEFEEVLKDPQGADRRRVHDKHEVRNFRWLYAVTLLLVGALVVRSGQLQIAQGARYRGLAEGNRIRAIVQPAPRGILYDRNMEQLVENVPRYTLALVPLDIPAEPNAQTDLFGKVSQLTSVKQEKIKEAYATTSHEQIDPVPVADITREQALLLDTHAADYPGVQVLVRALRSYDNPEGLSHVLGYVGSLTAEDVQDHPDYELTDQLGKTGVEQSYEETLRGTNGAKNVEVDAFGQVVSVLASKPAEPGRDLVLSIDAGLQKVLYDELSKAAERSGKKRAAAVAIDPRSGEILALVSVPGYDINVFTKGTDTDKIAQALTDPNQPLFDRPVGGTYPPGSTFKPFVATGALAQGTITKDTTFFDSGVIEVGGQRFLGWKPGGHGTVNVLTAIANSVNGFFYSIGGGYGDIDGIGIAGIDSIAGKFGFGSKLGVELSGEASGLLPTPEWKEQNYGEPWYLGDTYNASIGQGFVLVTPLQLANATAAIANGGTVWWPHLGTRVLYPDGSEKKIDPKKLTEQVADQKQINIVRDGMRLTVTNGTGRLLADLPVPAAGKTGTAQFGTGEPNAWFTAFAPFDTPTIAIAVLVEQAGEGSDFSAPVARAGLSYYFGTKHP
ncbi:MAG: penicillin-binding protein 2 [Candidatus Andersenbacteria bacterium]